MKQSIGNTVSRALLVGMIALASIGLTACSSTKTYVVEGSEHAPRADAILKVTPVDAGNSRIELTTEHLMPPRRIKKGAKHYAVWVQGTKGAAVHVGNLVFDAGSREGSLETYTPKRSFTLSITAESLAEPVAPAARPVFRQKVVL